MEQAGATGNFPNGKICEDDEGELFMRMIIDKEKNVLIVDFGKEPVTWIGLDKLTLKDLIERLLHAYSELT
jgi:hypothetical protein